MPSPAILGATIRKHISSYQESEPKAVKVLSHLFADDLCCRAETSEEAPHIYQKSKDILAKGGFNLRKWKSNSPEVLSKINEDEESELRNNYLSQGMFKKTKKRWPISQ